MKITSYLFGKNLDEFITMILTEGRTTRKFKFTIHTVRQNNEMIILSESKNFEDHLRIHEKEGGF